MAQDKNEDIHEDINTIITEQSGGKQISDGGYGCVYYPALNCDGTEMNSRMYISKLQRNNYAGKNEINISKLIMKIPLYKDFFVPVQSSCVVNRTQLKAGIIDTCEPLKDSKGDSILLMKMDFIEGDTLYNYLASIASPKKLIHKIIYTYNYLTQSLSLLLKHNIIHYDLKSPNVMFSSVKNIPYIIDFGLSISMADVYAGKRYLKDYFYVYAPDYYIWCPEIHLLSYIANVNSDALTLDEIAAVCKEVVAKNSTFTKIYSSKDIREYANSLVVYYKEVFTSLNSDTQEFTKFLITTYDTWDNYSLSIMYLKILLLLKGTHSKKNGFVYLFSQLLVQNLSYDPKSRLNLIKLDEYMLIEMYQYNGETGTTNTPNSVDTTSYINAFMHFLKNVSSNHNNIKNSLQLQEREIVTLSKTIERNN